MGLAIRRRFVEAMQGTISARNRSGRRGASFSIVQPARDHALLPEEEETR
jgi:two-component system sensor histidine kinase KdpD